MGEQLRRELNKTYLIFDSEGEDYEETYETEMLIQNTFTTILPLHVTRMDGKLQIYFEVTSRQNLKECADRAKLTFQVLYNLFETIGRLTGEIKAYLLEMECVQLDLEHIYIKEGICCFCYCPWKRQDILYSFRHMLEEILAVLDYNDTEAVALAYHFYQSVCKGNFQIEEILKEHQKNKNSDTQELKEEICFPESEEMEINVEAGRIFERDESKIKNSFFRKIIKFFLKKEPEEELSVEKESVIDAGEEQTVILEIPQNETILLENMPFRCWKLYPLVAGYDEFCVSGEYFLVGKKRDAVDGYIGRETISRIHSRLFVRNERLYVQDANSTNGTFVNGIQLQPGEEVEILSGDRILFADVGYECYNSL